MALTSLIQDFHFLRPWWFLALPPLVYMIVLLRKRKSSHAIWRNVCDTDLLPHILTGQDRQQKSWPYALMLVPLFCVVIALAGPVWRKLPQPVYRPQSALVIILDLSASMRAGDIPPNRLERAKHKVIDILRRRNEGQTALVVFALEAFTVSPLTDDNNTIALMIPSLSDDLMPGQGSQPQAAISRATELLVQASATHGDVLLISDSAEVAGVQESVDRLVKRGYRLSVMGVGSEEGAPIALQDGGFLKDRLGAIVVPKLNEDALRNIARMGNGVYHKFSNDDADLNAFFRIWKSGTRQENKVEGTANNDYKADIWAEEGVWLLLPALPFVLLMFRRGWLLLVFITLLPFDRAVNAAELSSYFKNNNQNASAAYQNKDYEQAAATFKDAKWKSAAYYKAGDYQKALDQLRGLDDSESIYNRGNILAKMGKFKEAISAYDEALKRSPENQDAQYNRDLIEQYLKQQQDQKNDSQKNSDSSEQNKNSSNNGEDVQANQQNQSDDNQQQGSQHQDENDTSDNKDKSKESAQQAGQDQQSQEESPGEDKSSQSTKDENNNNAQPQSGKDEPAKSEKDKQREKIEQALQNQPEDKNNDSKNDGDPRNKPLSTSLADKPLSEEERREQRLLEQWLRRVPDDPGGLLRRKFRYQSQSQGGQVKGVKPW